MNLCDAFNMVRRKMGVILPYSKGDLEWYTRKVIGENRMVFDRLAKS